MHTKRVMLIIMFMGALIWTSAVAAEQISGIIDSVDTRLNMFSLERNHPVTGDLENLDILIESNTKFKGIRSFEELESGDQVEVDVSTSESGLLKAERVKAMKDK